MNTLLESIYGADKQQAQITLSALRLLIQKNKKALLKLWEKAVIVYGVDEYERFKNWLDDIVKPEVLLEENIEEIDAIFSSMPKIKEAFNNLLQEKISFIQSSRQALKNTSETNNSHKNSNTATSSKKILKKI